MKPVYQTLIVACLITFLSGCASIVSKSNWPISVETTPARAHVSITNKRGITVFEGKTPAATTLKSGSGFFGKESYVLTLSMKGYETKKINLECKLNGWYMGNIFLGGLIGMLIVDPATGAMYRLSKDAVSETLVPQNQTTQLNIIELNTVADSLKTDLVKLN